VKLSKRIKLGIIATLIITGVVTVYLLFPSLENSYCLENQIIIQNLVDKLQSDDIKVRQAAAKNLLERGAKEPVFRYYTGRYDCNDVKKRMAVVNELCEVGDKGKEVMKDIFKDWCSSPSQQVKIPVGMLTLKNGSTVEIKSLWVDKYEVTNEKIRVFSACTGFKRLFMDDAMDGIAVEELFTEVRLRHDYPAEFVSGHDAIAYANWLGIRLPTKYEWEYVARAGSTGKYCFGDNVSMLGEYAWYEKNSGGKVHSVGQKKPNKWGLYDVHGNVTEWCYLNYKKRKAFFTKGGAHSTMLSGRDECSFWKGNSLGPKHSSELVGFRCVRGP